ncbi:serine/threonine-protein kinase MARK1 [Coccidioides immitis RMSCC 3703]|uniref:Serine/threonine-protein kinase MARK1 n=1 Tax=Coccidioides immitis RMSCC 3703 TaxID=454286 RepID=A0A0J8TTI2_COCIT|nr:serine/threonine-protein kinase MARK1 [Coccidioides immitis RMSCC 3703]
MKDPSQGWTFGINSAARKMCNVLLGVHDDVRHSGKKISAKHFRIYFNFESGILVLQNESQHGTTVQVRGEEGHKTKLVGRARWSLDAAKVTEVTVDDLEFLLYHPTLSGVQKLQHQSNWRLFAEKYKTAIPGLGQLILSSAASTRPPSQRMGLRNGYTMFEGIGRGEFGIVRRAVQYHSGAIYAVKEFFRARDKQEAKNLSEIATLQCLLHPHIVEFVDLIADQAGLALIMDFMPLGNLRDQHRRKNLSRTELKTILRQVLTAVAYLHGVKHVHRDIKPENILLKGWDPPIAKLSDFGLTARDGFLTTECGTKKYAAPEIYIGHYDKSIDIWSTAVTAFDITDRLPDPENEFTGDNWPAEVQRRVTAAYRETGDPFLQLLEEMLHKDPKSRPSAAACLSDHRLEPSPKDHEFDLNRQGCVGQNLPTTVFKPTAFIRDSSLPATIQGSETPTERDESTNDPEPERRGTFLQPYECLLQSPTPLLPEALPSLDSSFWNQFQLPSGFTMNEDISGAGGEAYLPSSTCGPPTRRTRPELKELQGDLERLEEKQ